MKDKGGDSMQENKDKIIMPHSALLKDRQELHLSGVTDVDSFDETEYTYTCTGTDTWYQKFYENSSNTQQSCGHYGNPYIAVHYCNMCGEQVYTEYMEGCNTRSCSNYLHPAAESTSHPGTHTYKHQGVRYECTKSLDKNSGSGH